MNPSDRHLRPVFSSKVVPVILITHVDHAEPMALALLAGGIDVMEVTLRHPAGIAAIESIAKRVPQMHVGAGTVRRPDEIQRVQSAGARFALSPGFSEPLSHAALAAKLPFIPGVMTPGELMRAQAHGFSLVKLFPAEQAGGVGMVKALRGPFADMHLCPTGGVTPANMQAYLQEPNVAMVGGSWLTPADAVACGDWARVTQLAKQAMALAGE